MSLKFAVHELSLDVDGRFAQHQVKFDFSKGVKIEVGDFCWSGVNIEEVVGILYFVFALSVQDMELLYKRYSQPTEHIKL